MSPLPLPLGQALADYLRVRRALGFKLDRAEHLLTQYVAYLGDHNVEIPTIEDALAWATLPADANPRWWAQRLSMVRPFAACLHARDPRVEVVPPALLRSGPRQTIPYLYAPADITALITAAATLPRPLAAATYQTLIGLLAVTGMRVGEAIRLDRDDLDLDLDADHGGLLGVRDSNFGKSRLLPLHPTTVAALQPTRRSATGCSRPRPPGAAALHRRDPAWRQRRLAHLPPAPRPGPPHRPLPILHAKNP